MQPAIRPASASLRCVDARDRAGSIPPNSMYLVLPPLDSFGLRRADFCLYPPSAAYLALVRNLLRTVPHAVRGRCVEEAR
jgi:hypothetical protein